MKETVLPRPLGACTILEGGKAYCIDPVEDTLALLARRWMMLVVTVLGNAEGTRFNALKRAIPGVSPRALSQCLTDLVTHNLAVRAVDDSAAPPTVTYSLTAKGRTLRRALIPLIEWAST